jgi:hypothetical protein
MLLSKKLFLWIMGKTQVLPKQTNFGERNELPKFFLTFSFATQYTRIVVPQFQYRVEVSSSQAEVSSTQAALRMRVDQNRVEVSSSQAAL